VSALTLLGVESWVEPAFNGIALSLAVILSGVIEKHKAAV